MARKRSGKPQRRPAQSAATPAEPAAIFTKPPSGDDEPFLPPAVAGTEGSAAAVTSGEVYARAVDALSLLLGRARRAGLRGEELEAAERALDQWELVHLMYRWTVLRGAPPTREEWAELDGTDGWPTLERVDDVIGSMDELLAFADIEDAEILRAVDALAHNAAELEREREAASAAERAARRTQGDAEKTTAQRRELERQLAKAKETRDEARLTAEGAERSARQAQLDRDAAQAEASALAERLQLVEQQAEESKRAAQQAAPPRLPAPGLDGVGRAAYALWLTFEPGTDPQDVIADAARWLDIELADELAEPGPQRRRWTLPKAGASVEAAGFAAPDTGERLWEASLRNPYGDQLNLYVGAEVCVAQVDGRVHAGLTLRLLRPAARLDKAFISLDPPKLPRGWVDAHVVIDAGRRLTSTPEVVGERELQGLAALIANHDRRLPVVLQVAPGERQARGLAGLAHVLQVDEADAGTVLEAIGLRVLVDSPERAAIVWPGALPPVSPRDVSLITARGSEAALERDLASRTSRVVHAAAVIGMPAPQSVDDLRRRVTRARLTSDTVERPASSQEALDWNRDVAPLLEENAQLLTQRDDAHAQAELLRHELDEAQRAQRAAAYVAPAETDVSETPDDDDLGDHYAAVRDRLEAIDRDGLKTVAQAVESARSSAEHLVITANAVETAADSPYRFPHKILEDLIKLDRVAECYLAAEFGASLKSVADELNLSWVEDSNAADHGKTAQRYRYRHEGREHVLREHVRVGGRAPGDDKIARIYLTFCDGADGGPRQVLVGHVGRKLPDSTT